MRPVSDPVTAAYRIKGPHWALGYHTGIDYGSPTGTICRAATSGRVVYVGWDGWGPAYGFHLVVESDIDGTTYRLLYAHMQTIAVDDFIEIGDDIGLTGATGNVTGPHLHFEVREAPYQYGDDVNPQIAVEVEQMTEEDWQRLRNIVKGEVEAAWTKHITVTKPNGEDEEKRREQILRETWQEVKREL